MRDRANVVVESLERRMFLAGDFGFAISGGGAGKDRGNSVAVDPQGNVVIAGVYTGAIDVDPSSKTRMLPATNGTDTFIAKYSPTGALLWAAALGGMGTQEIQSVAVDRFGNVFGGGYFSSSVDFDPGTGKSTLTSYGGADAFILKLSTSGTFQWVRRMGGTSDEGVIAIAADPSGNVLSMGMFVGTGDFDPNAGVKQFTSSGSYDLFVTKLTGAGNTVFVTKFGASGTEFGNVISADASGNVIASGSFSGTVDFNPGTATNTLKSSGSSDVFVTKLSPTGAYIFARKYGSTGPDQGGDARADAAGNIYVTGQFYGTIDFNHTSNTRYLSSVGGTGDAFVVKLTSAGGYSWSRRIGGSKSDRGTDLSFDANGNVFVTGVFAGTVDFNPNFGTNNLSSYNNTSDIFAVKLASNGNFGWARNAGGASSADIGEGIAVSGGNVYVTGAFGATVDFNPGSGTAYRTASGSSEDFFLWKLVDAVVVT
jgi:hypothetical protein